MAYGIEHGIRYKFFEEWQVIIGLLEYPDIKTAIIKEYEKSGRLSKTAKVFGVTGRTIANKLRAYGYAQLEPEALKEREPHYISRELCEVECLCPKCRTKHMKMMIWIGRGIPRKFCVKCNRLRTEYSDVHQEIYYDWRPQW